MDSSQMSQNLRATKKDPKIIEKTLTSIHLANEQDL
jgi:hypothetical protein